MHYIKELVHDRTIILQYCPTDEQIADIFTKRFLEKKFTYLSKGETSNWVELQCDINHLECNYIVSGPTIVYIYIKP